MLALLRIAVVGALSAGAAGGYLLAGCVSPGGIERTEHRMPTTQPSPESSVESTQEESLQQIIGAGVGIDELAGVILRKHTTYGTDVWVNRSIILAVFALALYHARTQARHYSLKYGYKAGRRERLNNGG